ncbi:zinc finger protein [Nephila pilipes]|uniref:Zinc finger protein n=1 Tax=Nephila pilipes TaxID=299642 RepID=A0A8X6PVQ4_NEPPI|nr:zinc finger protein [Nephila pilipes]
MTKFASVISVKIISTQKMECWKCDICRKSFTGIVCLQQHEASEKHKKKLRISNGALFDTTNITQMETDQQYHCSVCSFSVSGLSNYQRHVNSLEHANMIQTNSKITTNCVDVDNKQAIPMSTFTTINSMNVIAPYTECKPCKKQFSGPEPYEQHLASAAHIKKCGVRSSFQMQKDEHFNVKKENFSSNELLCDSEESGSACYSSNVMTPLFEKCGICNMIFSDSIQYKLHVESDNHRKKLDAQVLLNSIPRNSEAYLDCTKCVLCDMTFSGPVPYEQHLQGKSHKKKIIAEELAKKNAINFPSAAPESISLNSTICKEECNTAAVQNWYCGICEKQCSGPIPYNTHISSKDHEKNVRISELETKIKKIRESGLWPDSGLSNTSSFLNTGEVSAADVLISEVDHINNVNKPQMKTDLTYRATFPDLNIIMPEDMDINILRVDEEISFDGIKKRGVT